MSEISRAIRADLTKGFPNGNPLENIGLSPSILDLGLTNDELYIYCRTMARHLTAHFHSDRPEMRTAEAQATQRVFEDAFNSIKKDRALFERALDEFRKVKSEERANVRVLRTSLEGARSLLEGYRSRETQMTELERRLAGEKETVEREALLNRSRALVLEEAGQRIEQIHTTNRALKIENVGLKSVNRGLFRYVSFQGVVDGKPHVHVYDARIVVAASLSQGITPSFRKRDTFIEDERWEREFYRMLLLYMPRAMTRRVLERWKVFLAKQKKDGFAMFAPHLQVFELKAGRPRLVLGRADKFASKEWRFLGSTHQGEKFTFKHLRSQPERPDIQENLVPFLVPGGLLVAGKVVPNPPGKGPKGNTPPKAGYRVMWEAKRLILDAF